MLFPEEDSPLLKAWIVKRLENTSDADADVLADYVLALLHSDDGSEDVKSKCMSEMGNFLTEDPSSFVNDLFQIIQYKSYLPGAAPPPKAAPTAVPPITQPGFGDPNVGQPAIPTGPSGGSARKRGFQDRGDFDAPTGRDQFPGGRQYKQPRRGGRKGYVDLDRPQSLSQEQYPFQNNPGQHALSFGQPGQVPQIPPFDPSNPMEAMRQLQQIGQQMGLSMPNFAGYSQPQHGFQQNAPAQQGRKGRCWDFDRKGFCPRGIKCKFDHSTGTESVPYNLPAPQLSGHIPLPGEGPFPSQFSSTAIEPEYLGSSHGSFAAPFDFNPFLKFCDDFNNVMSLTQQTEYDPSSATLSQPPQTPQFPQQQGPYQGNAHPNQNRNNRQGQQRRKGGQGRAPFSAEGPVNDRSQTKVVVESIPEENFEEEQVRNFFAQFGNVEEVTMMGYKRLAIVKFDNWASANAAYKSPKVIFDNRFVKVFWYKDEKHSDMANGGGANGSKNGRSSAANGVKREDHHPSGGDVKMEDGGEEEIDMEEFTRKQEEAQRLHEEKTAKLREIERQREELERRQKELQAKQAAERQRLMEKLARKNSSEAGGAGDAATTPTASNAATEGGGKGGAEASKTEALKATLAKLRGEAEALGIDPNDAAQQQQQDDGVHFSTTGYAPSYRGRGGGRGGYGYRGRGGYVQRGGSFRGGARGGGGGRGNFHAAYAAFSLDNRPKTVAISGVDFSAPEKDEALRRHLFSFGEGVTEIQTTPAVTHLSFSDRKQAELFYNGFKGGRIPGINDGEDSAAVEVSWVSGPAAALPGSTTSSVNTTGANAGGAGGGAGEGLDSAMDDADAGDHHDGGDGKNGAQGETHTHEQQDHEQQSQQQQQQQQQEPGDAPKEVVDYDVAGENEWDE